MRKYFQLNNNENTRSRYLWDARKAMLKGKFIALNTILKRRQV